jgi:mono/diheme cytochrome c family protein
VRVLGVALFIAFWVVVALALFGVAVRPGRSSAGPRRGSNTAVGVLFVVTAIVFGAALPLLMLTGNHSNASAQVSGLKLTPAQKTGRELFGQHCAVCHTLTAANAIGKVGPNLDQLAPDVTTILRVIAAGCLPNAPSGAANSCLGQGVMPAQVLEGRNAQDVASFIAKVTGSLQ